MYLPGCPRGHIVGLALGIQTWVRQILICSMKQLSNSPGASCSPALGLPAGPRGSQRPELTIQYSTYMWLGEKKHRYSCMGSGLGSQQKCQALASVFSLSFGTICKTICRSPRSLILDKTFGNISQCVPRLLFLGQGVPQVGTSCFCIITLTPGSWRLCLLNTGTLCAWHKVLSAQKVAMWTEGGALNCNAGNTTDCCSMG